MNCVNCIHASNCINLLLSWVASCASFSLRLFFRDWSCESCGIEKLKELAAGCDAELLSSPSGSSLDEGQQGAERNADLEPT